MTSSTAPGDDPSPGTAPGRAWRVFAIPGILALIGYVVLYGCDARLRTRRGPWEVRFLTESNGTPALRISQESLGIRDVAVRFVGERLPADSPPLPAVVTFDQAARATPFGRIAFDDLMYLPGTVVLHCFGHEVQLVPRTLYLNRQPQEWVSGTSFELQPHARLPTLDPPPKPGRRK